MTQIIETTNGNENEQFNSTGGSLEQTKEQVSSKIEAVEKEVTKQIANKIKFLRNINLLSQTDFAKLLGVSFQQVQKYESGATRISAAKLCIIASIFNVDSPFFFKDTSEIKNIPTPIQKDKRVMEDIKFISEYFSKKAESGK